MIRWASIEAITDDAVQLRIKPKASCQSCTSFCQKPLFDLFKLKQGSVWLPRKHPQFEIKNPELIFAGQRTVGQTVGLEWSEGHLLHAAFRFYVLPLIWVLMLMWSGHMLFAKMPWSADLGAIMGLCLGLLLSHWANRMIGLKKALPKVTFL